MNTARTTPEIGSSARAVGDVSKQAPRGAREGITCLYWQPVSDFHGSAATAS